jgi:hypothetical protein
MWDLNPRVFQHHELVIHTTSTWPRNRLGNLAFLQAPSVIQKRLHWTLLEGTLGVALSGTRTHVYGVENRNSTPKL